MISLTFTNRSRKLWHSGTLILFASITGLIFSCSTEGSKEETAVDLKAIVAQMSLEQKAQLVVGTGFFLDISDSLRATLPERFRRTLDTTKAYDRMVKRIKGYLPGTAGITSEFPELGITSQALTDGPAGLRITPTRAGDSSTYYCTAFPIATLLASSWDTDLIESVGKAMGQEVLEYGSDVLLGPGMNIQRDPLCGRNFEYYSEDPLVSGKMAAAMVRGVQSNNVGTSIKHFVANNQETNRRSVNTIVSERALREIYLKGFEIAVKEASPWTVMSSYNVLNGTYTSESYDLLTKVLREDWGFKGYVMTDWGGGRDAIAQMKAGNDMIQPGNRQIQEIIDAVNSGDLDVSILDQNIERILNIMVKTPRYNKYPISNKPDLEAHAAVTRQAASEGLVLLENRNNALPFASDIKNVAAFGNTSYEFISGGTGSGDVNEAYTISLVQALESSGFVIDKNLQAIYKAYIADMRSKQKPPTSPFGFLFRGMRPVEEMKLSAAIAADKAAKADIALITIGRNAGEGGDRKAEPGDFYLSQTEKDMIKTVSDAFHKQGKKSIVILNVGGVVETASWRDIPDAVLCAWQPGQEGGNSVVDVMSGKVNPSGKLAITFPVSYDDAPSAKTFPGHSTKAEDDTVSRAGGFGTQEPWEVVYEEDIYVGYRYYNTFDAPVAYEFGYGKSYTTFEYSNLTLSDAEFDGQLTVTVDVTNTGDVAGKEVVQVYVGAPDGKLQKPESELAAFAKTRLLAPGATETVTFTIDAPTIASYDEETSSWLIEAGDYSVKVGASSRDTRQTGSFTVANDIVVEKTNKALTPQVTINRLTK
jgi:beta-glucosidase